jgi:glycosyltransferase involved in cell wall biosynthesis
VGVVLRTEHLPYLITEKWQQDQYTGFLDLVDTVICVSDGVRRSFAEAGIPAHKLRVVLNGVQAQAATDAPDLFSRQLRAELDVPVESKLVLTVGRLTEQKGYGHLLQAACQVAARVPDAHFLLAGEGPLQAGLEATAEACGAAQNVHFLGSRPDVKDLMRACDLFVLPSLFEGLPLVVLEAMSAGRAVVATNVCGTNEAVVDRSTGLLVPPGDPRALSEAIIYALTNESLSRQWGEAGRERVLCHFAVRQMSNAVASIYRSHVAPGATAAHSHESHGVTSQAHSYQIQGQTGALNG